MARYRRNFLAGGSYFFTVTLENRHSDLLTSQIDLLRSAFNHVRQQHPFDIDAIVVLPDHLHAILTLPVGDKDFPMRWRLIKSWFSRQLPASQVLNPRHAKKSERGIWQRRYWEHTLRDELDVNNHVNYIHINPVKHGYVKRAIDWPYSSIHRYVKNGVLPVDWAGDDVVGGAFGE